MPVAAFAASAVLTALLLWTLLRTGLAHRLALDHPNERSLHAQPVPRVGGAVLLTVAMAVAAAAATVPATLLAGMALLTAIGFIDDRRGLPIIVRLAAQVVAAALLVRHWPVASTLSAVAIVVAATWAMNAYNFMDGSDGLAGGMALIGFGCCGIAASASPDKGLTVLCLALAGAAAGFLLFNFPPARVFMGDAGSVPLGFAAAGIGVAGTAAGNWPAWFVPLVFSPFLLDASCTLLARIAAGRRPWRAHREHAYQRLVRAGFSHRRVALLGYGLMLCSAIVALAARDLPAGLQVGAAVAWSGLLGAAVLLVRRRHPAQ